MKYKFEIHEKAIGKERPRYSSKTHRMYTPRRTSTFEEKVRNAFLEKYNTATEVSTKAFKAKIIAIFEPTKSLSKKKKRRTIISNKLHKKPDRR